MFLPLLAPEHFGRRVMFGLELVDPFTGWLVQDGLKVSAAGWGKPLRPPSGRYVWIDVDPTAQRQVAVRAVSLDGRYEVFEETLPVPEHVPDVAPASLLFRRVLVPTGRHAPPPGLIAAAGQVRIGNPPQPLAGVRVTIALRHDSDDQGQNGTSFTSAYEAVSDAGGSFVVAVTDLGDIRPDRRPDGTVVAWLRLIDANQTQRFTPLQPLHASRLTRLAPALRWETLALSAPF